MGYVMQWLVYDWECYGLAWLGMGMGCGLEKEDLGFELG
jgi:hypothetical protein